MGSAQAPHSATSAAKKEEGEGGEEMGEFIKKTGELAVESLKKTAEHDEAKSSVLDQKVTGVDSKTVETMENGGASQGITPTDLAEIVNYTLELTHLKASLDILLPEVEAYINTTGDSSNGNQFLNLLVGSDAARTNAQTGEVTLDPKRSEEYAKAITEIYERSAHIVDAKSLGGFRDAVGSDAVKGRMTPEAYLNDVFPLIHAEQNNAQKAGQDYAALSKEFSAENISKEALNALQKLGLITDAHAVRQVSPGHYRLLDGAMKQDDLKAFRSSPEQAVLERAMPAVEALLRTEKGDAYDHESDAQKAADRQAVIDKAASQLTKKDAAADGIRALGKVEGERGHQRNYTPPVGNEESLQTALNILNANKESAQIALITPQIGTIVKGVDAANDVLAWIVHFLQNHPNVAGGILDAGLATIGLYRANQARKRVMPKSKEPGKPTTAGDGNDPSKKTGLKGETPEETGSKAPPETEPVQPDEVGPSEGAPEPGDLPKTEIAKNASAAAEGEEAAGTAGEAAETLAAEGTGAAVEGAAVDGALAVAGEAAVGETAATVAAMAVPGIGEAVMLGVAGYFAYKGAKYLSHKLFGDPDADEQQKAPTAKPPSPAPAPRKELSPPSPHLMQGGPLTPDDLPPPLLGPGRPIPHPNRPGYDDAPSLDRALPPSQDPQVLLKHDLDEMKETQNHMMQTQTQLLQMMQTLMNRETEVKLDGQKVARIVATKLSQALGSHNVCNTPDLRMVSYRPGSPSI